MPASPKEYVFVVEGRGTFPIDMLRYDRCWPRTELNSSIIYSRFNARPDKQTVKIGMRGLNSPTVGRWESFGWKVGEVARA